MKLFSQGRIIQAFIFVILFSFIVLFYPNKAITTLDNDMLADQNPFLIVEKPEKKADDYFRLVGAEVLDDQMLERIFRDFKIAEIYEGTNEIQKMILARTIFGRDLVD